MAINIDFLKEYEDLIPKVLSPYTVETLDGDSDIPQVTCNIPEKYRKSFIHTENSFVEKYCKPYDKPNMLIRTKRKNTTRKNN